MGQVGRLRKPRPHACYLYTTREGVVCVRRSSLARKKPTRRVKSLPPCPPTRAPRRLSTSSTRSAPAHRCEFDWQFNTIGFGRIATKNQWPVNWRERTAQDEFYFWTGVRLTGPVRVRPRNASTRNYCRDTSSQTAARCTVRTQSRYSWMSVESPLWSVYFTRDFKL